MDQIFSIFNSNITSTTDREGTPVYRAAEIVNLLGLEMEAVRNLRSKYKACIYGSVYVTEPGVYVLAFESETEVAKEFQDEIVQMLCRR